MLSNDNHISCSLLKIDFSAKDDIQPSKDTVTPSNGTMGSTRGQSFQWVARYCKIYWREISQVKESVMQMHIDIHLRKSQKDPGLKIISNRHSIHARNEQEQRPSAWYAEQVGPVEVNRSRVGLSDVSGWTMFQETYSSDISLLDVDWLDLLSFDRCWRGTGFGCFQISVLNTCSPLRLTDLLTTDQTLLQRSPQKLSCSIIFIGVITQRYRRQPSLRYLHLWLGYA